MKITIQEFEQMLIRRGVILRALSILDPQSKTPNLHPLLKQMSSTAQDQVMDIMNTNPVYRMLGSKLFFSTLYREDGLKVVQSYVGDYGLKYGNQTIDLDKVKAGYSEGLAVEDVLIRNLKACSEDIMSNNLTANYIEALLNNLMGTNFEGCYVEGYPDIEYRNTAKRIIRTAEYSVVEKNIRFCPTDPLEFLGPSLPPGVLLIHEAMHANDLSKLSSGEAWRNMEKNLQGWQNGKKLEEAIKIIATIYSPDLVNEYKIQTMVDQQTGSLNPFDAIKNNVPREFIAFFAERAYQLLYSCKTPEELPQRCNEYFKKLSELSIDPSVKLPVTDVIIGHAKNLVDVVNDSVELNSAFKKSFTILDEMRADQVESIRKELDDISSEDLLDPVKTIFDQDVKAATASILEGQDFTKSVDDIAKAIIAQTDFTEIYKGHVLEVLSQNDQIQKILDLPPMPKNEIIETHFIQAKLDKLTAYTENLVKSVILESKDHFLNQQADDIQKVILENDQADTETSEELTERNTELQKIKKELEDHPDDDDLKTKKAQLDEQIAEIERQLKDIEEKQAETDADREKNEEDKSANDDARKDNDQEKEKNSRELFGK